MKNKANWRNKKRVFEFFRFNNHYIDHKPWETPFEEGKRYEKKES
jgi:hypothetical protein